MSFPSDVSKSEWENEENWSKWNNAQVTKIGGVQLLPLEAKSLHVIGSLVEIFDAASYLLYCGSKNKPYANYYGYAYLLACSAIELLGRCYNGTTNKIKPTLKQGLKIVDIEKVDVNVLRNGEWAIYEYNVTKLLALRNLIAHGQGVASAKRESQEVFFHVELLNSFPNKLTKAFDNYYENLFVSSNPPLRRQKLAKSAVEPVLYSNESGQVYRSPIELAYKHIYQPGKKPSQVLRHTDWEVYNPDRDKKLE